MSTRKIAYVAALVFGAFLLLKCYGGPEQESGVFLANVDFNDGAKYVLVVRKNGVQSLIDQNKILQDYKDDIFVSGLNALAFLPGERARAKTSIRLYRNGAIALQSNSHSKTHFDFSDIARHGVTVEERHIMQNKVETMGILEAMQAPDAPQVFLLEKPAEFKPQNFTLKTDLPTFWISSQIPKLEIDAELRAKISAILPTDQGAKSMDLSLKRYDFVPITDDNNMPILDADGTPVTLGEAISFYRAKLTISCDQKQDCDALKAKMQGLFDDVLKLRDADLLDGLENPLFPKPDGDDNRAFSLDISITHKPWARVDENRYFLRFFEEVK